MMIGSSNKKNNKKERSSQVLLVRAYASLLQQYCEIVVTPCDFYFAGRFGPATADEKYAPCSLMTIEPFCPGGLRRLVLNSRHSLIIELATKAASSNSNPQLRHDALQMGAAMIWTASWPSGMDVTCGSVQWQMAKGLICGPHWNMIGPVPHDIVVAGMQGARDATTTNLTSTTALAIWPRRIYSIKLVQDKGDVTNISNKIVTVNGDTWIRRDELLWNEWREMLLLKHTKVRRPWGSSSPSRASRSLTAHHHNPPAVAAELKLATYAPCLPILALAQFLQRGRSCSTDTNSINTNGGDVKNNDGDDDTSHHRLTASRATSLSTAASVLLSCDRLFCLSVFFGVPLMDRTDTLCGALRVQRVVESTPTRQEVETYMQEVAPATNNVHDALEQAMMQRAETLWNQATAERFILVCWSGGIDSTALLVCLLRTTMGTTGVANRRGRLSVILDDESIRENPTFYKVHIDKQIPIVRRNHHTLSELAKKYENKAILVTGELGDQLFGSDRCKVAFLDDDASSSHLSPEEERLLKMTGVLDEPLDVSLDDPWEDTLLPLLDGRGLLFGGRTEWKAWIAPQLAKAPFPIVTLHDMLWWLNFSCKWQNVSLRCLHDGGGYLPTQEGDKMMTGAITHFYDDRQLECWACVPAFHKRKFGDLHEWCTYKEPLKLIIHSYHPDDDYYRTKTKVGSLCFELEEVQRDRVESVVGLVLNSKGGLSELFWGVACMRECQPDDLRSFVNGSSQKRLGLDMLLEPWILNETSSKPAMAQKVIHVNPWLTDDDKVSPFVAAPQFAEEDERQRRHRNPVTAVTLDGKCSCLLPPDLIRGKSVLDLGACLGAMCHWSLYHGAKRVVGVEPQQNFCERMHVLLDSARHTWPEQDAAIDSDERFQVVCADAREFLSQCADQSFDVIVVAGVLHCFQDPIGVLLEMARVAKEAVVVESVHPAFHLSGLLGTSESSTGMSDAMKPSLPSSTISLLELAPSAAVNKAGDDASFTGLAVIPSKELVQNVIEAVGFSAVSVALDEHPTKNEDVLTYTGARRFQTSPIRFFLRCTRKTSTLIKLRSLEETVITGKGKEHKWTSSQYRYWTKYQNEDLHQLHRQEVATTNEADVGIDDVEVPEMEQGVWKFDEKVSKRFDREARSHIPDYVEVVGSCLEAVATYFGEDVVATLHVVDVGCAIGYTILQLLKYGFRNVYGYDISSSMIEHARQKLEDATATFDAGWTESSYDLHLAESANVVPTIMGYPDEAPITFDAVFVNWTLQFLVSPDERLGYLSQLFAAVKPSGLLFLTDKTDQNATTKTMYYDWKAASPQNVSREEIRVKEGRLRGVLETLPVAWYLSALAQSGFVDISILRAKFGFVTFLCRKPPDDSDSSLVAKKHQQEPFIVWENIDSCAHEVSFDGTGDPEPYTVSAWGSLSSKVTFSEDDPCASTYGYVYSGEAELSRQLSGSRSVKATLIAGMYFACPGKFRIKGGTGFIASGALVKQGSRKQSMFAVGGPLEIDVDGELTGRLPYIDGCTDTLLVHPVIRGAPCLNHLHFPAGIKQTQHTHPSGRAGMVVRGRGQCVVIDSCTKEVVKTLLKPGMVFVIPKHSTHAFETSEGTLDVVAFHPDSDFGPTATDHPMVNRTIVGGVSASLLPSIQTLSTS